MEPILKKANIQDIPTLNQIAVTSKSHWNYPPEWIEKWMDELTRSERDFTEQHIYKLVLSDKTIGYCAIQEQDPEYEVTNLWVLPTYIGKGYGKLLLNETIRQVVTKPKSILVEADPNAEAFYASQGFVTFDKKESFPKGRYLPLMRKKTRKP